MINTKALTHLKHKNECMYNVLPNYKLSIYILSNVNLPGYKTDFGSVINLHF